MENKFLLNNQNGFTPLVFRFIQVLDGSFYANGIPEAL